MIWGNINFGGPRGRDADKNGRRAFVRAAPLGFIETSLPFKTALLLAPNFKQIISPALGWPLYAIAPDRDFLYLWAASRSDFIQRVGGVVVREFTTAPYFCCVIKR